VTWRAVLRGSVSVKPSRGRACEGRPKRASGRSGRERSVATSASNFNGFGIAKDAHGFVRPQSAGLKRRTAT
jgi:hypothetical protein